MKQPRRTGLFLLGYTSYEETTLFRLVDSEEHIIVYVLVVTKESRRFEVRIVLFQNLLDRSVGIVSNIDVHEDPVITLRDNKVGRRAYLDSASLDMVIIRIDRISLVSALKDIRLTVLVIAYLIGLTVVDNVARYAEAVDLRGKVDARECRARIEVNVSDIVV